MRVRAVEVAEWLWKSVWTLTNLNRESLADAQGAFVAQRRSDSTAASDGWELKDYVVAIAALAFLLLVLIYTRGLVKSLLVYTAVAYLIFGLRRPALALGTIIIMELTILTFPWEFSGGLLTLRYGPILAAVGVAAVVGPMLAKDLRLGPGAPGLILSGIAFVTLVFVATAKGVSPARAMEAARFFGMGVLLMVLMPLLIKDRYDLKVVGKIAIAVFVFSGITALLQGYGGLEFTAIRDPDDFDGRIVALTKTPVRAANTLLLGFLVCFAMVVSLKVDNFWGLVYLAFTALLMAGWYYTYTRSALFGAAAGVVAVIPFLRGRVLKDIFVSVLVIGGLLGALLVASGGRYTRTPSDDRSAAARVVQWKVGTAIALDNLAFGTGYGTFAAVAPEYLPQVDVSAQDAWFNAEDALTKAVHNDFIRVWLEFGSGTLLFYVLLYAFIARNLIRAYVATDDPWLRGAALGAFAALAGYAVNSSFHNYLNVSYALWLIAGFSIALLKVLAPGSEAAEPIPADSN